MAQEDFQKAAEAIVEKLNALREESLELLKVYAADVVLRNKGQSGFMQGNTPIVEMLSPECVKAFSIVRGLNPESQDPFISVKAGRIAVEIRPIDISPKTQNILIWRARKR